MDRRPKRSFKQLTKMVEKFNSDYPVGTECVLHKDSGDTVSTRVERPAIVMGFHTAVAWFEGVSGCYAIDRVKERTEVRNERRNSPLALEKRIQILSVKIF